MCACACEYVVRVVTMSDCRTVTVNDRVING